ncbi:hypothetical protein BDW_06320 [Bdellovibrio bacteriovorus W]|nr:hypothetical protein BDW_06320 [Bdellovibrio bacteriovorus W]
MKDTKTKLGQGLLKGMMEILESESDRADKSAHRIESEAQLIVAKEKIAELKVSLRECKNEKMKKDLQKSAQVQVEALIQELEESIRVYEFSRSRK